jgi:hypothetical protein
MTALPGHVVILVRMRSIMLVRRWHAMVVVTQAVGGRSALRERKANRWSDRTNCIRYGKNNRRSPAPFFRQLVQHGGF